MQSIPILVACTLAGAAAVRAWRDVPAWRRLEFRDGTRVNVHRVLDATSFVTDQGVPVRLIGLSATPTTRSDEESGRRFLERRIGGREVVLSFDRERLDRDEYVLANVTVGDEDVGLAVVRAGWASVLPDASMSASRKRALLAAARAGSQIAE